MKKYGWIPSLPDHRDLIFKAQLTQFPLKTDLRAQCPPVYDQGNLGSCTANAIGAAIEFEHLKQFNKDLMPYAYLTNPKLAADFWEITLITNS